VNQIRFEAKVCCSSLYSMYIIMFRNYGLVAYFCVVKLWRSFDFIMVTLFTAVHWFIFCIATGLPLSSHDRIPRLFQTF